ncbi:MAG: LolA family protein, partial [Phycisphaerae bacterium]
MTVTALCLCPLVALGDSTGVKPQPAKPSSASVDPKVHEILGRLEQRDQGLRNIKCTIKLVDEHMIELTKSEREGTIQFLMTDPNPLWMIYFEKNVVDGSRWGKQWYLFDGRWLWEAQSRLKQVTRYEYVKPGEKVDFFDLDRAPFPLPFGQKRDKILKHFDVTLVPPQADDPAETDHLVCIPKAGSRHAEAFTKLE